MNGYAFGYGIGNKEAVVQGQHSNSSLIPTPEGVALHTIIDADVDVEEALFLALAIFLLCCYVGLLRLRAPPIVSTITLTDNLGLVNILPDRTNLKRSGLTTELIEARLKSFTVDSWLSSKHDEQVVSNSDVKDHCAISFEQESCAICLESYWQQKLFRALPCDHIFHQGKCTPTRSCANNKQGAVYT